MLPMKLCQISVLWEQVLEFREKAPTEVADILEIKNCIHPHLKIF